MLTALVQRKMRLHLLIRAQKRSRPPERCTMRSETRSSSRGSHPLSSWAATCTGGAVPSIPAHVPHVWRALSGSPTRGGQAVAKQPSCAR